MMPRATLTDPKLPALEHALHDGHMHETLSRVLGRGGTRCGRVRHTVIKHTPGKRCVVEYRIETGAEAHALHLIAKLYRADRAADAFATLERLWLASRPSRFRMPEPLAFVPELGMTLQARVPGLRLLEGLEQRVASSRGEEIDAEARAELESAADNLAALHALPPELAAPKPLDVLVEKLCRPGPARLMEAYPRLVPRVLAILARLEEAASSPATRVTVHGDLGVGQILVAEGRACFVDFDGLCVADPALDLANLVVSLRMRLADASEAERVFLARYLTRAPLEHLGRFDAYVALAYLRRAAARYRRKNGAAWEDELARLLESGADAAHGGAVARGGAA